MEDAGGTTPGSEAPIRAAGVDGAGARSGLALRLKGQLPCMRCGYDLGGLSIRAVCPECGTPIKATLLVVVDPHARELQPLPRPGLVASGLLAWALGALGAAALGWWIRVEPMVDSGAGWRASGDWSRRAAALMILISGVGALALIRPHARIPRWRVLGAAAGAAGTFVLAGLSYWIWMRYSGRAPVPAVSGMAPPVDAALAMLAQAGLLALVIIGLRPNARLLEARSLLLRSGRVDRQTLYAVVAAVGVVAVGHVVNLGSHLLSGRALDVSLSVGTITVAVGWMLFTVGLLGVLLDVARLCPVLLDPAPSLGSLLARTEPSRGGDGAESGR